MNPLHAREALRQQTLLRALLGDAGPGELMGWMRDSPGAAPPFERGLAAYRANAGALAERALAAAFPTLRQLVGEDSFGALARHFWQRQPPLAGDIAQWGDGLPAFVADAPTLADEPYLADVARVDWAVHVADRARDDARDSMAEDVAGRGVDGLALLGERDPSQLWLRLAAGTVVIASPYPVVAIWQAHHRSGGGPDADRFAAVRTAFEAGLSETALVFRPGWAPRVVAIGAVEANFSQALMHGRSLADALQWAGDSFDFAAWLIGALRQQRLAAVVELPAGQG